MPDLTPGQRLIAANEAGMFSHPSELAKAIDEAIAEEREACAKAADPIEHGGPWTDIEKQAYDVRSVVASAIRARGGKADG